MDTIKRVYEIMKDKNLTFYQLTKMSGISHSTINTTEKRGGQLKIDTIERFCDAVGIPLSEFFAERSSLSSQ